MSPPPILGHHLPRLPVAAALGLVLAAAFGCSGDKTFAHVTVRAAEGEYEKVRQFLVYVSSDTQALDTLYYPIRPVAPYSFSATEPIDFSISFPQELVGRLKVGVEPRDSVGDALGYGEATKMIDPGHVFAIDVTVIRDALPPAMVDAGAPSDAPTPDAALACVPTAPASCGPAQTCEVACETAAAITRCVAAGAGQPGQACLTSADCAVGSQCLEYACGMPPARICMKSCTTDADCGDQGRCFAELPCGDQGTGYRICSVTCDPRSPATAGCAAGLSCLLFPDEVTACDCAGPTRVGVDGAACVDARDCAPGFICVITGSEPAVCRPICKLGDNDCEAGRICDRLVEPVYETWGACVVPVSADR